MEQQSELPERPLDSRDALSAPPPWWLVGAVVGTGMLMAIGAGLVLAWPWVQTLWGAGESSSARVVWIADMPTAPERAWEYRYAGASEEYIDAVPTLAAVGPEAVVVMPRFDYWSWRFDHVDQRWYEGFPRHYADGFAAGEDYKAAGVQYEEDFAAWNEAWNEAYAQWQAGGDMPWDESLVAVREPEFPAFDDYWQSDWDGLGGYAAGWEDALSGARGDNELEPPADPRWRADATLLDMATGDVTWTIGLTEIVDHFDYTRSPAAVGVSGGSMVVFAVPMVGEDQSFGTRLVSVSASSGEVRSTRSVAGAVQLAQGDGGLYVLARDVDQDSGDSRPATLSRLDPARLDAEPQWTIDGLEVSRVVAMPGHVGVLDLAGGESMLLDAASGERAAWARDLWIDAESDDGGGILYEPVDGQWVRTEISEASAAGAFLETGSTAGSVELVGVGAGGDRTWDRHVDVWLVVSDGRHLMVGEPGNGDTIGNLMRIDPRTGARMWEAPFPAPLTSIVATAGPALVALDGTSQRLVVIDLATGHERHSERLPADAVGIEGDGGGAWASDRHYYLAIGGHLTAYSVDRPGTVWSVAYDEADEFVAQVGNRLMVTNTERRTLELLD